MSFNKFQNEFKFVKYNVALDIHTYMQHDNMRMPVGVRKVMWTPGKEEKIRK